MALLGAGEVARAEAWVSRCAARALAPDDVRRSNHAMAREVGLPVMRALVALTRGQADLAAETLYAVRGMAQGIGGSHAQRDVIDQTLLAAAARGSHRDMGRALVHERLMAKPITPLTRHWLEALGLQNERRA